MERIVISLMNVFLMRIVITMENVYKRIQQQSQGISRDIICKISLSPTSFIEHQRNATASPDFMEKVVIWYQKSRKKYPLYHPTSHLI